jgi:hypothetical protein
MFGLDAILLCRASFGRSLNGVSALCSFVRSAVDTVATLAILGSKDVNVDPMLFSIVFGESGACVRKCSLLVLRLGFDSLTWFCTLCFLLLRSDQRRGVHRAV